MRAAKARIGILIGIVIGAVVSIAFLVTRSDRSLLARSRAVTWAADWQKPDLPVYYWLSDREVLFFRARPQGRTIFYAPVRRNLASGTETELPLGRLFTSIAGYGDPSRTEVSPDHQWMLWWNPGGGQTYLSRLDGTHCVHWHSWDQETHWLGDSRHCISWQPYKRIGNYKVTVHVIRSPTALHTFRLNINPMIWLGSGFVSPSGRVITLAPNGRSPGLHLTIFDTSLAASAQPTIRGDLRLPENTIGLNDWRLSPQGDRLALVTLTCPASPLLAFWQRLFPRRQMKMQEILGIWVCRVDGKGMHEVGHILIPAEENPTGNSTVYLFPRNSAFSAVRWLPDGKRLSYVYKGELYTVPAGG